MDPGQLTTVTAPLAAASGAGRGGRIPGIDMKASLLLCNRGAGKGELKGACFRASTRPPLLHSTTALGQIRPNGKLAMVAAKLISGLAIGMQATVGEIEMTKELSSDTGHRLLGTRFGSREHVGPGEAYYFANTAGILSDQQLSSRADAGAEEGSV
ncbi:hypothetical protein A1Q2_03992 [Trichosporon asahii var. asahii CBS 8904]|uniref:Uncharacterized protein n=1 Tax=Trichosporon asahii var. asahii (strain CBS 8904) TaxID=1220162 RepID=K1VCR6_TRIAC|nr:hypothetical protein A1Q2_03992 [Trichosporon asahii var. asahii CBS 8904]